MFLAHGVQLFWPMGRFWCAAGKRFIVWRAYSMESLLVMEFRALRTRPLVTTKKEQRISLLYHPSQKIPLKRVLVRFIFLN